MALNVEGVIYMAIKKDIKLTFTEEEIRMVENRDLTPEQIKEYINKKYRQSNYYTQLVKEAVASLMEKYKETKKPLIDLIRLLDSKLKLVEVDGHIQFNYDLSLDELEYLAMKIPALCVFVQEFADDKALDAKIASIIAENKRRENLSNIIGGTGQERIEIAKQYAQYEELVSIIKKNIVDECNNLIERADKLYEGIKKVLDVKKAEIEINKRYAHSRIA